jgi:hypothetical protein
MTTDLILGVLAIIQQLIPLLGGSTASTNMVATIVTQLEKWLPMIIQEVDVLYQPVKNIIAALSTSPATVADQAAQLAQLDAQLDAAFEAAAAAVNPDAPAAPAAP